MAERNKLFGRRAEAAAEAIARAGALLNVLRLSKVNLTAPEHLLTQSRGAVSRKDYDSAGALAARAERLASVLEGRHRGAQNALNALRGIAGRAREVGLGAPGLDATIEEARRVAHTGTVEDGITIPNYLQARSILDDSIRRGQEQLKRAQAAANEIFTADLAIDALKDANRHMNHGEFERVVVGGQRALIERAKQALAVGDIEQATDVARQAEEGAKQTRLAYRETLAALQNTERTMAELKREGTRASTAEGLLEQGRLLLQRARIAESRDALQAADREARRIALVSRRATSSVKEAEESLTSLARAVFVPEDAQRSLRDAKRALSDGRFERAEELAAEARRALGKREEVRDRLARLIQETKRRVEELRAIGTNYASDAEEMVHRAERGFENGDFATSSEDLKIATLLMGSPRARGPPGKVPSPANP